MEPFDNALQVLAMELKYQDLAHAQNEAAECLNKVPGHFICRELLCEFMASPEEAYLDIDRLEVGRS